MAFAAAWGESRCGVEARWKWIISTQRELRLTVSTQVAAHLRHSPAPKKPPEPKDASATRRFFIVDHSFRIKCGVQCCYSVSSKWKSKRTKKNLRLNEMRKMIKVTSCLNNRSILYTSDLMGCFVNQEEEQSFEMLFEFLLFIKL